MSGAKRLIKRELQLSEVTIPSDDDISRVRQCVRDCLPLLERSPGSLRQQLIMHLQRVGDEQDEQHHAELEGRVAPEEDRVARGVLDSGHHVGRRFEQPAGVIHLRTEMNR